MRIPAPQARAVSRGAKSQHRIPVDTRLTATPLRPATRHSGRPFCPHQGDKIILHGGHREPGANGKEKWVTTDVAHATITVVTRGPLGTLTAEHARAEGHDTVTAFEIAFVERHDRAWLNRQVAYLIGQGTRPKEAEATRTTWALARYQQRWAPRDVWLLEITAVHDIPVFLAPASRPKHSELGYVHSSSQAIDDTERVLVTSLHRRWRSDAATRHHEAVAEEDRRRRAKQLARQVKQLAIDGHPVAEEIRTLLESSTEQAA